MAKNNTVNTKIDFDQKPDVAVNKKLSAEEWNQVADFQKSPVQPETIFTDTSIVIDGTKSYSTTKVVTGATRTITAAASGHVQGNNIKVRYQFDIDCTLTLANFDTAGNNTGTITPIPAGTYGFQFFANASGVNLEISQNRINPLGQSVTFSESTKAYNPINYFPDYTQPAQLNFTKHPSVKDNEGRGGGDHGIIIANGDAWNFSSEDFDVMPDSLDIDGIPIVPTAGERYSLTRVWRGLKFTAGYRLITNAAQLVTPVFRLPLNLANTDATNYGDNVTLADDVIGANDFSALIGDSPTLELDTGKDYVDFGAGSKELKGILSQNFFNVPFSVMTILKPLDGNPASLEAFWGAVDNGIDTGTYAFIRNDGRVSVAYAVNNTKVIVDTTSPVFVNGVNPETNIIYTVSDANGILIYINGLSVATGAPAIGALMSNYNLDLDFRIGAYTVDGVRTLPYSGKQREVLLYGKELAPEEALNESNNY